MVVTSRPPVLVVVELSGGNDFMNTVVLMGVATTTTPGRISRSQKIGSCR